MSRIKNIIGDVEVNRDLLLLLTVGGLYSLSIALSNTFVNVYLWKQSGKFLTWPFTICQSLSCSR